MMLFNNFSSQRYDYEYDFEDTNKTLSQKTGQKGHEFSNQKGPQQMQNFLHEEKYFFCKLISLYTINNLCVVI